MQNSHESGNCRVGLTDLESVTVGGEHFTSETIRHRVAAINPPWVNPMDHQHDYEHDNHVGDAVRSMEQAVNSVCYHQNCPVCGRNLRIRVMLLGRLVYCQHCGGGFTATDACEGTSAACEGTSAACEGTSAACEGTSAACEGTSAACEGTSARPAANRPQSAIVNELIERAAVMLGLTSGLDASGQEGE